MATVSALHAKQAGETPRYFRADRLVPEAKLKEQPSRFAALLFGGVVIAGGLLAFLFYDSAGNDPRDTLTTGSIVRVQPLAVQPVPSIETGRPR